MNRSPIVTAFSGSLTQQFVRKTKGDYENDNFRVMVTAVDKYLIGKNKNAKLFLREVLKQLWQQENERQLLQLFTNQLITGSIRYFFGIKILYLSDWILWFQNSYNKVAIEIRYMYVQFWLRLKEESWDWIDWQESRGSTRKKNTGESERMKTRNEAKKKKKYRRVQN